MAVPFGLLLGLLFIGLKLTGYIAWSWLWVLSPIWIPFAIFFTIIGAVTIFAYVATSIRG